MGNRGVLHDGQGQLGSKRWRHSNWICCKLAFKGRKRSLMQAGRYTELFFLDEAVALSAGHRPCAECRRQDYLAFRSGWAAAGLPYATAKQIDGCLHAARIAGRGHHATHRAEATALPDGTFIRFAEKVFLVNQGALWPYRPDGYGNPERPPNAVVTVLTPAPTVAVLRAGFRPILHPSIC